MIQKMAWAFGIFFILIAIAGFVPAFVSGGLLFGTFSAGATQNVAYLVSGALALLAAWGAGGYPRLYFKVFGILYALATIIGFLQGDTVLGVLTVTAADNFLHLVIAAIALWAGFGAKPEVSASAETAM